MAIYNYIQNIEPTFLWYLIVIFAIVVLFVTRIVQPSIAHLTAISIGLLVIYYFNDRNETIIDTANEHIANKLLELRPKPEYFHMDSNLIEFFWNIREFREYNRDAYDGALKATDNILKFEHDAEIGIEDYCEHTLDNAKDLMTSALNDMHTIIFKTPLAKVTLDKHKQALKTFQLILRQHIDNIFYLCKRQRDNKPITNATQIRYNMNVPDNYDITSSNFDFY